MKLQELVNIVVMELLFAKFETILVQYFLAILTLALHHLQIRIFRHIQDKKDQVLQTKFRISHMPL